MKSKSLRQLYPVTWWLLLLFVWWYVNRFRGVKLSMLLKWSQDEFINLVEDSDDIRHESNYNAWTSMYTVYLCRPRSIEKLVHELVHVAQWYSDSNLDYMGEVREEVVTSIRTWKCMLYKGAYQKALIKYLSIPAEWEAFCVEVIYLTFVCGHSPLSIARRSCTPLRIVRKALHVVYDKNT